MAAADASDTSDRILGSVLSVVKKAVTYTQSKSLIHLADIWTMKEQKTHSALV